MKFGRYCPIVIAFALSGCSLLDPNFWLKPTDIDKEFSVRDHFIEFDNTTNDKNKYWVRNGYKNYQSMFYSYWDKTNISYVTQDNSSCLAVNLVDKNYKGSTNSTGGELTSAQGFLYGYFGARMKVFSRVGTVQSFFTYNAPSGEHPEYVWDEIDIEFLGKNTTKVQFNYYHEGIGGHEYYYDLGFDAKDEFHDYGFLWEPDQITWFVDFEPVYTVNANLSQWGFVMLNVWAGNPEDQTAVNWLGKYETQENVTYTTYYDYIIASKLNN